MRSVLCYLAILDDINLIRAADGGKPVRDCNCCSSLGQAVQALLNIPLALIIKRARCLVEDQDLRIAQENPGDRNSLLLPAR